MAPASVATLQRRIHAIQRQLATLGRLRPGTLSQQYNVCGTPGCRCKADPPEKHGPYYQLSYTWHGKSRTNFVREQDLEQVHSEIAAYEQLRRLVDEWIDSALEIARLERELRRNPQRQSARPPRASAKTKRARA